MSATHVTDLTIREDDLTGPEIVALLREHLDDMRAVTPPGSVYALDLESLRAPGVTFWTAWHGDELVGCGALKELDARHGEIKSMRTAATHRGRGVASRVLVHIMEEARSRGYDALSLETGGGAAFEPARALYARHGFRPCGPFGTYTFDPNSAYMTRSLHPARSEDDAREGDSITAYDVGDRVRGYDADMDVMHPHRHTMVGRALDLVEPDVGPAPRVLDLGAGTGFFAAAVLDRFPEARIVAVDGAPAMLDGLRTRLGSRAGRVEGRVADLRMLGAALTAEERFDLVVSAFTMHHLTGDAKRSAWAAALGFVRTGGWFVNADIVVGASVEMEERYQDLRVRGILRRARPADPRFADYRATRAFLDDLEARERDQPLPVETDLRLLREAGLRGAEILWLEYREALIGGRVG